MKREGEFCVVIKPKRYDDLPEYSKKYYNKIVKTNKSIKQPYNCPNGRKHCIICSNPAKSAKNKNLYLRDLIVEINKDPNNWSNKWFEQFDEEIEDLIY
jgi:hypothetical protein